MRSFLTRYASEVKGTLSGFDRVRFRGTLRWLANTRGMGAWLHRANVLLKDFRDYAMGLTDTIKQTTQRLAEREGRPMESLASSSIRKEDYAKDIALLGWLGVEPRIAKRKTEHGSGLGKVRWVVERTISWLKGLRRLRVRYDRLRVVQEAWNTLAAAVICFHIAEESPATTL